MINPKCYTSIEVKREHFLPFMSYLYNQMEYGGKKYKSEISTKEATDLVTEFAGVEWILGTMLKYLNRFKNEMREKDLFKISTYSFITWLQMGFHEQIEHDQDVKMDDIGDFDHYLVDYLKQRGYRMAPPETLSVAEGNTHEAKTTPNDSIE